MEKYQLFRTAQDALAMLISNWKDLGFMDDSATVLVHLYECLSSDLRIILAKSVKSSSEE